MTAHAGAAVTIRDARPEDIPAIAAIYGHHVLTGLASFEETAPSVEEMARRHAEITGKGYPYIVAEESAGTVVGYAYAGPYRPRPAYRHSVENSVYLAPGRQRSGIGSALLGALIARCEAKGYRQMVAVIGDSANAASIGLHARHGFTRVGTLRSIGYKHGRWVDSVLMQRALGAGDTTRP
ncbi:MAG: N-acetyltransferase [Alphaproteobacteria bacterium]|nr:N-acetyltransferase [Alphaproteobacteria bacterium]